MDFSVVLGIDRKTIEMLRLVFPTWRKHKPSLLHRRFVIFYNGVSQQEIRDIIGYPIADQDALNATLVEWAEGIQYPGDASDKWSNPQRAKMLAGFVHVPAAFVTTPYWLKLDLDVVAADRNHWVDPLWFNGNPSIIAPGWGYTKPPHSIMQLDAWANGLPQFDGTPRMNLIPNPGSDKVIHPRICSWCAFFNTEFTKYCARLAADSCGEGMLPIPSQDTYHWYCAERLKFVIRTVRMKRFGWKLCSSMNSINDAVKAVM
jgi:hypothetical protein